MSVHTHIHTHSHNIIADGMGWKKTSGYLIIHKTHGHARLLTILLGLPSMLEVHVAAGLASSPGSDIWLLEMPRRIRRLEGIIGVPIISGTELERFISS